MEKELLEKIRFYIKNNQWNWARSYLGVPHEYIVRNRCNLTDVEFLEFVHAQRTHGIHERWGRYNFPYLHVDGYKYWTMGDTYENTIIINRQKLFNEFDNLEFPISEYYSMEKMHRYADVILNTFDKPIFDIGCGNGNLEQFIPKEREVYAIDPSKKMIAEFRKRHPLLCKKCSTREFEGFIERWTDMDYVFVGLFGSPSYIMKEYLEKLVEYKKDHLLMFYNGNYVPEPFVEMHHFKYNVHQIRSLFRNSYTYYNNNYIVVSSKPIDWEKERIKYDQKYVRQGSLEI